MTGKAEAAKSRIPVVVLAAVPAATALRSNFLVDQAALARAVGAVSDRIHGPESGARAVTTDPSHPYTRRLLLAAWVPDLVRRARRREDRHAFAREQAELLARGDIAEGALDTSTAM